MNTDKLIEDAQKVLKEAENKVELAELLNRHNIEPAYCTFIYDQPFISFTVKNLTEAKKLLDSIWQHQKDFSEFKSNGCKSYFRLLPYRESDKVITEDVCLKASHTWYGNGSQQYDLKTYITLENADIEVSIKVETTPTRIETSHVYSGKTKKSHIREYQLNFYGLETGHINSYKHRSSMDPHVVSFEEYWQGIDQDDLDDILITHAAKN